VTNAEYELFDPRHADQRKFEDQVADLGRHPVVMVSWYDAWCFTTWLGNVEVPDGTSIRLVLPTEAQWEYACRAGSDTPFTWNSDRDGNKNEASDSNFHGRFPWPWDSAKEGTYRERTIPVDGLDSDGSNFPPNPWGFCQMHGNVGEWCWDWFDPNYYRLKLDGAVCNPAGPARASCRVIRGGGLVCDAGLCRSSFRDSNWASTSAYFLGFRLAAVPLESRMSGD
jgi:formylglycine-generating enzyme required for sulfatase activity